MPQSVMQIDEISDAPVRTGQPGLLSTVTHHRGGIIMMVPERKYDQRMVQAYILQLVNLPCANITLGSFIQTTLAAGES